MQRMFIDDQGVVQPAAAWRGDSQVEAAHIRMATSERPKQMVINVPLKHRLTVDGDVRRQRVENVLAHRQARPDIATRRQAVTVAVWKPRRL